MSGGEEEHVSRVCLHSVEGVEMNESNHSTFQPTHPPIHAHAYTQNKRTATGVPFNANRRNRVRVL